MPALQPDYIAVVNVRPAYDTSRAMGVCATELQAIGLPPATMADPDGAVRGEATYRHFELMAARTDYPRFVRQAVQRHTFSTLGVVGLACKTLDTIQEALRCHQRFQHLTNRTARYHSSLEGANLVFADERWGPPRPGLLMVSEYTALVALQLLRLATDHPVSAVALHTRSPSLSPSLRRMFEEFLGGSVHTGRDRTALVVHADVLALPVGSADAELADYFRRKLQPFDSTDPAGPALLREVHHAIQLSLAAGRPTAARVGRHLGMSSRTLQRRLNAHGVAFSRLLEQTRRSLAEGYLADPSITLAEVAYLCGYEEQTSFFRAFRKWTGQTPSARRAELSARTETPL